MTQSEFDSIFLHFTDKYPVLENLVREVESLSKVMNITAIKDREGIWQKHVADSLMISNVDSLHASLSKGIKVLDLGTGGGFPGLPLAISYPNSQFTLLDSTRKKVHAVDGFIAELGIQNAKTVWSRAEEFEKAHGSSKSFDLVTTRAVAYLPKLIEMAGPFLNDGGYLACYKMHDESELTAAKTMMKKHSLELAHEYAYGENRVIWVFRR